MSFIFMPMIKGNLPSSALHAHATLDGLLYTSKKRLQNCRSVFAIFDEGEGVQAKAKCKA